MKIEIKKREKVRLADISTGETFKLENSNICYMKVDIAHLPKDYEFLKQQNAFLVVDLSTGQVEILNDVLVQKINVKAEVVL